jgi:lysophospholipase L1-like esterase
VITRSLLSMACAALAACAATVRIPVDPVAVQPAPRDARWQQRVDADLAAARAGGHRLVFVGDSITQGWGEAGKDVWREVWEPRHALNLGISGDRTQHVLWRLDNGLLEALAAPNNDVRACVVMIGTNNSNGDDHLGSGIGDGIAAVVARLRKALPNAKVLLLAIFPRGERPNAQRDKCSLASVHASTLLAGDEHVAYRDIATSFLAADDSLPKTMMPDFLHLSAAGYRIWANAIVADVDTMLK